MDFRIRKVAAREILDSRGNPTVECDIYTTTGFGRAAVPSGASTGKFEAHELRDGGRRYGGLGVSEAVRNANTTIAKLITGMDCREQEKIDHAMAEKDGTEDKSILGANTMLAASLAAARAAASTSKLPLYRHLASITGEKLLMPVPFSNVINGGKHAAGGLKIQEFMIAPEKFRTFSEALAAASETYHELKAAIASKYGSKYTTTGDEGGFAPPLANAEEALQLLEKATQARGYQNRIKFAIDAAASEFYEQKTGKYMLEKEYTAGELTDYYLNIIKSYKITSLEDPFQQEDFNTFAELTAKSGIQIVGDDLLATNSARIQTAAKLKACNCLLLKPNQIGTLTEAIAAAKLAAKNRWKTMVSHRSGETEDTFIADLSVALGCGQIKTGAPARTERTAKYNQLLRIEEELGKRCRYGTQK
ncbi:phosphopyruvate hydratase [Candidatus Woesearchaeota archaeon]|nr:phosphopyruvate hydratase [Candidatus Woesearchaeota archaeon]